MNTHDIELPPLPYPYNTPAYRTVGAVIQKYAIKAIKADRKRRGGGAKARYDEAMAGETEPDPIERLRFYCSVAMSGQDCLDVEPFFDDVIAYRNRRGEPVDIRQEVIETLEMILAALAADWRKWEELASPDEFVRWAKSRANYALSIINEAPQPAASADRAINPITLSIMRDDGGEEPAYCVMAAYRTWDEAKAVHRFARGAQPVEPVKDAVRIYNSGYMAGHQDAVEGCFTDILSADMASYHEDVVSELVDALQDHQPAEPSGAPTLHNTDSGAQNGIQATQTAAPKFGEEE